MNGLIFLKPETQIQSFIFSEENLIVDKDEFIKKWGNIICKILLLLLWWHLPWGCLLEEIKKDRFQVCLK